MNIIHLVFFANIIVRLQLTHSTSLDPCTSDTKPQIFRLLALLPGSRCSAAARAMASADYSQLRLAMDFAIEHINSSNLLQCHTLELLYKESGCNDVTETALGLSGGLFPNYTLNLKSNKNSQNNNTIVGIIGPIYTLDSILVSSITNKPGLQMVTLYGAGSSVLANRTTFPNSLSILGSPQSIVDISLALMKKSRWKKIAILYENSSNWFYHTLKEQFIASIDNNTRILYSSIVTSNFYPIRDIATSKARVVFLFTSPEHSRRIMCLAHHTKLVYPSYQWVLVGQQLGNVANKYTKVKYHGEKITCSPAVLSEIALEKGFTINYHSHTTDVDGKHTFTNLSLPEFEKRWSMHNNLYNYSDVDLTVSDEVVNWIYIMYDAVWTWAVVLSNLKPFMTSGENQTFMYHYANKQVLDTLVEFYSVDFQGMSGRISFNATSGFLNRPVNLFFTTGGRETSVATYTNNGTIVTDLLQNTETISDTVTVVGLPEKGVVVLFLAIICVELITIVILHALTLLYRHSKYVKASSPKLIQMAFVGQYIFILAFVLYNLQRLKEYSVSEGTVICQLLWMWTFPICFILKMGVVIVRTWRIYRIFKHYLNPGRFISNTALLSILLAMVGLYIVYATVWTAVDPMRFEFVEYVVENGPTSELFMHQRCRADNIYIWLSIAFTYLITLLVVMIMLSFITRNIPNRTFATTSLRVFSYLFSAVFITGFCVYYFFLLFDPGGYSSIAIDYIVLCVAFNILVVIFLVFVIVPPIFPVLRNELIKIQKKN